MKRLFLFLTGFLFIFATCSGEENDSASLADAASEGEDESGDTSKPIPCDVQDDCLRGGMDFKDNCGANNQCYICKKGFCETLWELDDAPAAEDTALEVFNLSWDGAEIPSGCKFDMYFYSKERSDGGALNCADIIAGDADDGNIMFYVVPQRWNGQCRQGVTVTTQVSLIPAEIEFLWATKLYEGNDVGVVGELKGIGCKELNGDEPDSSGGYPKGFVRDSSSLYKPGMKIQAIQ
ncbi:MAG: hypothetical protein Kow0090_01970 [Myxococcota bacterium]